MLLDIILNAKNVEKPFSPATTWLIDVRGREDGPGSVNIIQKETVESNAKEKLELIHCWNRMTGKLTFIINSVLGTLTHTILTLTNPGKDAGHFLL